MKKVLTLVLALCLVLAFAACDTITAKDDTATTAKDDTTTTVQGVSETTSEVNVAYIEKCTTLAFHAKLNGTAKIALDALVDDGTIASWQAYDGQDDPSIQVSLIEDAINNGANFVVLLPVEAEGSAPIVTRCSEAGIPIVVANSKTNNTDELANAYVGSDDVEAGEMMANYVNEMIPDGGMYAHMMAPVGLSAQIERAEGITNIMGGLDNWELINDYACDCSADKAVQNATDALTQYGDAVKAFICDSDDMSSAVQAYCNSIDREDIICIGVDGNDGALSMIKEGTLKATLFQDGETQIATAISLIPKILAGETVESVTVPFVLITSENIDEYYEG